MLCKNKIHWPIVSIEIFVFFLYIKTESKSCKAHFWRFFLFYKQIEINVNFVFIYTHMQLKRVETFLHFLKTFALKS